MHQENNQEVQKNQNQAKQTEVVKKKKSFNDIRSILSKIVFFIERNKKNSWGLLLLGISLLFIGIFMIFVIVKKIISLNGESSRLNQLIHYDTDLIKYNKYTKDDYINFANISDVIDYNTLIKSEKKRYAGYMDSLDLPYKYFLQYLYLPRLHIWKDPFTEEIDTELIGEKYLKKNPYTDIKLLQHRSDFFKNVGDNNESNDVTNISIGKINENNNGFFSIPISVDFIANSKRSFLLLAEKIYITSNERLVSLINEFVYYLRQNIKTDKIDVINEYSEQLFKEKPKLEEKFMVNKKLNIDKFIGYYLYKWVENDKQKENILIDEEIIKDTISELINCDDVNKQICYYRFREKFRDIPNLAYIIIDDFNGSNSIEKLKKFFQKIPPIISISKFVFDKMPNQDFSQSDFTKYIGTINIKVHGKGIINEEVKEVSETLANKCFKKEKLLNTQIALKKINETIIRNSNSNQIDSIKSESLYELDEIIKNIQSKYNKLTNFNKIINLFEIYRMLKDANLCKK